MQNTSLFIGYQQALLTGLSLPMEMIASANAIAGIKNKKHRKWNCWVVSATEGADSYIRFSNSIQVKAKHTLATAPLASSIFVPPVWGNPDRVIAHNQALIEWLKLRHRQGCQLIATGTGVCLLAHAGLLEQRVATTHWYYFDQFEKKYPQVNLQRQHFITQDANLICTGSINALVDLVLYLIEQSFGNKVSQIIEQHYSHEINRTYDKPWFAKGASRHPDEGILEAQQWMSKHYSQSFDLQSLSEMANMSKRNFTRRFKLAVGQSPFAYALSLKISAAKELLKETNLSHQDIADHLGYRDNAFFARQFKLKTDLTPGQYRTMVRGKLFDLTFETGK
ncbi:MAG: helix-turn-helix domain-containing protein [Enterobacterales bacterium]|nr:helix-turn-helix domain-containing protein [Enterobacterales bacterium]